MSGVSNKDKFLKMLLSLRGSVRDKTLQAQLAWSDDRYAKVRNQLLSDGTITAKQGGVIQLSQQLKYQKEEHLYEPLKYAIESGWGADWQADKLIVDVTARSGNKRIGRWSRPDLCAVSLKEYAFLGRKQVDLWTFEVKPMRDMRIDHVLEAVAHSRFSHKTYIMFHIENDAQLSRNNFLQCLTEAERHGIGFVTFKDPNKYSDWNWHREAVRKEPNPGSLNDFIGGLPKPMRDQILKWLG